MGEFYIHIHSFQELQDFVALATTKPFQIHLSNNYQSANATSFMALVSLDHRRPLRVTADCTIPEFEVFRQQASRFGAK